MVFLFCESQIKGLEATCIAPRALCHGAHQRSTSGKRCRPSCLSDHNLFRGQRFSTFCFDQDFKSSINFICEFYFYSQILQCQEGEQLANLFFLHLLFSHSFYLKQSPSTTSGQGSIKVILVTKFVDHFIEIRKCRDSNSKFL